MDKKEAVNENVSPNKKQDNNKSGIYSKIQSLSQIGKKKVDTFAISIFETQSKMSVFGQSNCVS